MALGNLGSRAIRARLFHDITAPRPEDWVTKLAGPVLDSDQESETYAGLGNIRGVSEWKGKRMPHDLRPVEYVLRNQKFSAELTVYGDERRRNKTGQVERRIGQLTARVNQHWQKLVANLLNNGATNLAYDGVAFYSNAHTENGSANQTNIVAQGGGADPTAGAMEAGILNAVEVLLNLKDDVGEPINEDVTEFLVTVPIPLLSAAAAALGADVIVDTAGAGGRTNVLNVLGGLNFTLAWTSRLTNAARAFVSVADGQALIRQDEFIEITSKAENSDYEHDNDAHEHGVLLSRGAGYGSWQKSSQVTFS